MGGQCIVNLVAGCFRNLYKHSFNSAILLLSSWYRMRLVTRGQDLKSGPSAS